MLSADTSLCQHHGIYYTDWLKTVASQLSPRTYFEIGTRDGGSLMQINVTSVAVDPNFAITHDVIGAKPSCLLVQKTSDDFFASCSLRDILGGQVDLAFLDGMHLYEYLLRDFINTEKHCGSNSCIVMHDCLPTEYWMTPRIENIGMAWTGDVWKVPLLLSKWRPELQIHYFDCPPTGLVAITNLDRSSTVLEEKYFHIIEDYQESANDEASLREFLAGIRIKTTINNMHIEQLAKWFWF